MRAWRRRMRTTLLLLPLPLLLLLLLLHRWINKQILLIDKEAGHPDLSYLQRYSTYATVRSYALTLYTQTILRKTKDYVLYLYTAYCNIKCKANRLLSNTLFDTYLLLAYLIIHQASISSL